MGGKAEEPKTPEQLIEDAKVEAALILEEAQQKAGNLIRGASEKDDRKRNPSFKMEDKNFTKYDIVKCTATKEAKFHKPGGEYEVHGEVAELLVRKGEFEFKEISLKASEKGKHAIADRRVRQTAGTKK